MRDSLNLMKKSIELKIFGHVQGIFFRYNVKDFAQKLVLNGWVKNEGNYAVFLFAEGEESDLQKLIKFCYNGVKEAKVEKVDENWGEYQGKYADFSIKS